MNASIKKVLSLLVLFAFVGHVAEVFLATISISGGKAVAVSERSAEPAGASYGDSPGGDFATFSSGLLETHFCDTGLHVLCCHQSHQFLTSSGSKWVSESYPANSEVDFFSEASFPELVSGLQPASFISSIFHPPCSS